ncbi:MAG: TIGR04053 family radical SAM/SPASM domain-containing protein [Elusimicrobia bacterium]|nr:TIGR04053 family radical SAM/SPASM domain-containing protein [Elusimicrobiota bacterium]
MGVKSCDFDVAPFLVIWETTRSCALACRHCRASAILGRDPGELSTEEGKRLLTDAAGMGCPIFILSGGDPLNRPDLDALIVHGKAAGLRMGTIPAATASLTRERLLRLRDAGLDQLAFSLDGPTAELHDGFRGVPGAFDLTLRAAGWAREAGVPLQINTVLAAWNYRYLEEMVRLVSRLKVVFWEVFFLIPIGRGTAEASLTAEQFEAVFDRLHRLNAEQDFVIKLTEAPHYRRFVIQREAGKKDGREAAKRIQHIIARPRGAGGSLGLSPQAVNAGKGFAFVDYLGNVCPSGFLPIVAGNVRERTLSSLYRTSPVFVTLRDPKLLKGKCGLCEFSRICGGSRARANAVTGDPLASDPFCAYEPVATTR